MKRFRTWEAIGAAMPECRQEVLSLDDNGSGGVGAEWLYRTYAKQSRWASTGKQIEIDRMFGVSKFNPDKKAWDDFRGSRRDRLKLAKAAAEEGWLWPVSPAVPIVMVMDGAKVRKTQAGPALIIGTPREIFGREAPEYDARLMAIWTMPREKRNAELEAAPTVEDLALSGGAALVYRRHLTGR